MGSIVFRTLVVQHFMSFREPVVLNLDDQGLILVQGENRASAALSSNGVGKSAVIGDALCWVLFGETSRGAKFDAVANRHTTERCCVELLFNVGETAWRIQRTRRPASAELYNLHTHEHWNNADVFGRIEAVLGFGLNAFRTGAIFGQSAFSRFALVDPEEQLRVFDEILGVNFKGALAKATAAVTATKAYIERITDKHDDVSRRYAVARATLQEVERAHKAFATQQREWLAALKNDLVTFRQTHAELQQKLEAQKLFLAPLNRFRKAAAAIRQAHFAYRVAQEDETLWTARKEDADKQYRLRCGELRRLKNADQCPTCRRAIGEGGADVEKAFRAVIAQARNSIETVLQEHQKAIHQTTVAAAGLKASLSAAERIMGGDPAPPEPEGYLKWLSDHELRFAIAQSQIPRLTAQLDTSETTIAEAAQALETERARVWDGAERRNSLRLELPRLHQLLMRTAKARAAAERVLLAQRYWVEAFGPRGLRQRLYKSVSAYATDRLVHHLQTLAGGEVRAGMTTELFRGKERMALGAEWTWGAGDYATASSGQDRRLDLALFAAIQDVAERRTARGFPLRVFDEPSDALDERGKELLADWIMSEAATRGTTVVITHSAEFAAMLRPSKIWTVIFEAARGSYIVDESL